MGLYPIDCSQCGKPFMWFSGNLDQHCSECRQLPIGQSLYLDCLWELMEMAKAQGSQSVCLTDVDRLVVEKAKSIVQYKFKESK